MPSEQVHRRCLIVEDDAASIRIATQILDTEGWKAAHCRSAEEALAQTGACVPDLLLLDLGLPGIDGLTFCRQLRADPSWNDTSILVCTGRNSPSDLAAVLDAGADDYIPKPVTPALLRVRLRIAAARVERALHRRELEREATAFKFNAESSQDPVYWIEPDRHFRFVWVNDACCRHFLRRREELVGLGLEDIDPTFGVEQCAHLRDELSAHGSCLMETIHLRGDGSIVPAELSANRFFHEGHEYITGYIRDISARKASESALARAALLLSRMRDAVFCTELDGTVTFWNEGAERLFGWTAAELLGRPLLNRYPPELAAEIRPRLAHAATGEEWNTEWQDSRRDGTRVWIELSLARFLDGDGRPAGLLGIARDITERRRAADDRLSLERRLQETQKLESLGVLAGGIAHDFNNLLTGILGNASLAKLDLPAGSPLAPSIGHIETAALRAADLCHQMLAYSGKARFVVATLDLGRLVEESARLLHLSLNKKATLTLDLAPGLPHVLADATQLRQVVMNLVINAAEALGSQPGSITISTRRTQVDPARLAHCHTSGDHPGGDSLELRVADTGCGMSSETLARIFDPFFTTKFTGRGLGLSAVLGIVRGHHGALEVTSTPGQGTTFAILLPAAATRAAEPDAPAANSWKGAGTILVADDEEPVRDVLANMLERLGFDTVTVADGIEALASFRNDPERFAAVLLDLSMPRCDGVETLHEIRRIRPDTPVLLISGHGSGELLEQFAQERLAGIVQKPFTTPALHEALQRALAPHSPPAAM
jgi:two-component system, cell cycle sensor histidine kinase and response regulator CckA